MTVKLIESIKETEGRANDMIRDAQQKARQMVKEAEDKAARLLKESIAAAEKESKELLAEAEAEARQETTVLVETHRKKIEGLKMETRAKLPDAIAMIVEKVVRTYADS